MVGIYMIKNELTNEVYIGQSVDVEKRWGTHLSRAANKSYDTKLYRAMREYGVENFTFSILKKCPKKSLNVLEKFYVEKYNALSDGYNEVKQTNSGARISQTKLKNIIAALRRNVLTMKEIAAEYGVGYSTVNQINRGVMYHNPTLVYPIRETTRTKRKVQIQH